MTEAKTLGTSKFLLKFGKTYGKMASFAATQADLATAAQLKLPSFYERDCLYTRRSLEQCTSEPVAKLKASLFSGKNLLILAAGLGVDDWSFSTSFEHVVSVDPDEDLNAIAIYNYRKMGLENILRLDMDAEKFLEQNALLFDLVYVDPDRRKGDKRQILLSEHEPDIIALLPVLKKTAPRLLIKCSPMYDHEMAARELENIRTIYIISHKGEVKEMLVFLDFSYQGAYQLHCIESGEPQRSVVFEQDKQDILQSSGIPEGFFYEASAGIVKVRKHHQYASDLGLYLLDSSVPFYCSPASIHDFMGRRFRILNSLPVKSATNYLKEHKITKANLKVRGLKYNTSDIYKKWKIGEGGADYFFIFPFKGDAFLVHCRY